MQLVPLFALALALTASPVVAGVLVVQPGHPAAHPQIQAAVDAAQDGDVVLVKSGAYTTFQVLDKSIAIVADAGANVVVAGAARVRALAATRDVLLAGLTVVGEFNAFDAQRHGLYVKNCAGSVRLVDCAFRGADGGNTSCVAAHGALIEGSADVAFSRCVLRGHTADYVTGDGLVAQASTIALYSCDVAGGVGGTHLDCSYGYENGGDGGHGIALVDGAFAFAARSTIRGGDGGAAGTSGSCDLCLSSGDGGDGVRGDLHAVPAEVFVALDCTVARALAGSCSNQVPCWPWCVAFEPGTLTPRCGGQDGHDFGLLVTPGAFAGSGRALDAPRVVREGALLTLSIHGTPGDQIELRLSEATRFDYLPASRGVLVASSRRPQPALLAGTVPGSGTLAVSWTVADLGPGVLERTFFVQASHLDASGATILGAFAVVTLLDASL